MEKVAQIYHSFEEAEEADDEYYASLTPQQRMEILFQLIDEWYGSHAATQRLKRVCRVTKLQ